MITFKKNDCLVMSNKINFNKKTGFDFMNSALLVNVLLIFGLVLKIYG
jgi:hypothetical protein